MPIDVKAVLTSLGQNALKGQMAMRLLFVAIALFVMGGLALAYQEMKHPGFFQSLPGALLTPPMADADYQETFKAGMEALRAEDWDGAKAHFERLGSQRHALQPIALMNLSKALAGLGREGEAQRPLKRVVDGYPRSHLAEYALYLMAQSHMRARQFNEARHAFEQLVSASSESDLGIGSRYYLGEIALQAGDKPKAYGYWRDYLAKSPEGAFSATVAQGLFAAPDAEKQAGLTAADYAHIAQAFLAQDRVTDAANALKKSTLPEAWLLQAQVAMLNNKVPEARAVLLSGLKVNQDQATGEAGLRLLLKNTPAASKTATLKSLAALNLTAAGDLVLWELINTASPVERNATIQTLLTRYPKSDWGPESSWMRMWSSFEAGQRDVFIQQATQHLAQFPYSRSAPRVLFWRAKAYQAMGKAALAEADLSTIVEKYPMQFYAWRAKAVLNHETTAWRINHQESLPDATTLPMQQDKAKVSLTDDAVLNEALAGLFAVGEMDEALKLGDLFASPEKKYLVSALAAASAGKPNVAIKQLREGGFEAYRKGDTRIFSTWPSDIQAVYYPLFQPDLVAKVAQEEGLSPYLVLALTRQESAFDQYAVSSSKAMGLMQLLPSTAQEVATQLKLPGYSTPKLFFPEVNLRLGSHYLKGLHARFNGNSIEAIGAYNGGPGSMTRWKAAIKTTDPDLFIEKIPYTESREYIKAVYGNYWNYHALYTRSDSTR